MDITIYIGVPMIENISSYLYFIFYVQYLQTTLFLRKDSIESKFKSLSSKIEN